MLDFGNLAIMPVKETPLTKVPPKPDDCIGQKMTPKRPSGDLKESLLKGGSVGGIGDCDELMLEVTCGQNQAALYMSRLQLGSKGTCVLFENSWLTPNEFQYISGRETAKDWKRSIKHHGKSLKVLISKGILTTSPLRCSCGQCAQSKDKDVSKYIVADDVKMTTAPTLRDVFTTDPIKLIKPETAREANDRRLYRAPSESNENKKDAVASAETPAKPAQRPSECLTSHSLGGARYPPSCDKSSAYGLIQEGSFRSFEKQDMAKDAYPIMGTRVGLSHLVNNEQNKMPCEDADARLKSKKKSEGNENDEHSKEGPKSTQNGDQRKTGTEAIKNDLAESTVSGTSQKRSASSGTKTTSGSAATWSQSGTNFNLESSYHPETVGTKPSPHDKTKKSNSSSNSQSLSSCVADKPSCGQITAAPSGKNSNSIGSGPNSTRLPPSEPSFMFSSFGSPYYPMIGAPQLPAYYPNPYMWSMPFSTNPSTCSYGWTAPSEMTTPNCLRSPVKDPLDCNVGNADQAFNFPWMKRSGYSAMDRETTSETVSSGKRKLDCDASDYFPPSKHPLYLSESLRSAYGESLGWPGYNPNAAALDFRFLPYNIPSYIPDIRPTHGLFASNFLKGGENPAASSGLGLYPGLFPTPCLGVNSR